MDSFPYRQAAAEGRVSGVAVSRYSGWQKRWTPCMLSSFLSSMGWTPEPELSYLGSFELVYVHKKKRWTQL